MRRLIVFVSLIASIAASPAFAQSSVYLEELTWTEVRDGMKAGKTTVIVPTGGTEQNGPHMVIGKENYAAHYNAGEIAKRLGNAYVAPNLAYVPEGNVDPPSGHLRFPGSITLPEDVFTQVLVWAGRSFKVEGFKNVVFIGNSGGNQNGMNGPRAARARISSATTTPPFPATRSRSARSMRGSARRAKKTPTSGRTPASRTPPR
jgi:creatinine amidohydrolase